MGERMIRLLLVLLATVLTLLVVGSTMMIYDLYATRLGTTPGGTLYYYNFSVAENETIYCIVTTQGGISCWE